MVLRDGDTEYVPGDTIHRVEDAEGKRKQERLERGRGRSGVGTEQMSGA